MADCRRAGAGAVRAVQPGGDTARVSISAANDPSISRLVFTITGKVSSRSFSLLKVPTSSFTFKTINYTVLAGAFSVTIIKNYGSFAALLHMSRVEMT